MKSNRMALILVDPFNDFLSEGGKLLHYTKQTIIEGKIVLNLKILAESARANKLQVIYAPHRNTLNSDYLNWKFLSPSHAGSKETMLFEIGSWGLNFIRIFNQKKVKSSHQTIGRVVASRIRISISY